MSDPQPFDPQTGDAGRGEIMSALFAQMVTQQANMALLLLGAVPHPETGETLHDLESARFFIDQLEMLEVKTRGNLTRDEEHLLRQTLTTLRLAFVKAVETPAPAPGAAPADAASAATDSPASSAAAAGEAKPAAEPSAAEADAKKKFSKKY
jgi:hypothetical protein